MADQKIPSPFAPAIAELDRQIKVLQQTREMLVQLGRGNPAGVMPTTSPDTPGGNAIAGDPLAVVREQEFAGMSWTQAARVFLQRIGRNEKTMTIIAALRKGGIEVSGKNPMSKVYTSLVRHSAFVALGKNYWDLAERRPDLVRSKADKAEKKKGSKAKRVARLQMPKVLVARKESEKA